MTRFARSVARIAEFAAIALAVVAFYTVGTLLVLGLVYAVAGLAAP